MAYRQNTNFFNGGGAAQPFTNYYSYSQSKKQPYKYQPKANMPNTAPGFDYSAAQREAARRAAAEQQEYQRRLAQQRAAMEAQRERERLLAEQQMRAQAEAQRRALQQQRAMQLYGPQAQAQQAALQQHKQQAENKGQNLLAALGMNWTPGMTMGGMPNLASQLPRNLIPNLTGSPFGFYRPQFYQPPGSGYQDPGEWGGQTAKPPGGGPRINPPGPRGQPGPYSPQDERQWALDRDLNEQLQGVTKGYESDLYFGIPEFPEFQPGWSPGGWTPGQFSPTRYSSRPQPGGGFGRDVRSWYEAMLQWRIGG